MKLKIKYLTIWLVFSSMLMFSSCGEDFLDVADPLVMSLDTYPQKVDDLEPILVDLYGRLGEGYFGGLIRMWPLLSHDRDHGYNGAQYNEFALNELTATLSNVRNMWFNSYEAISKANTFLESVAKLRAQSGLTTLDVTKLDKYEGQARFLRAFNYFYLVNLYGESPILTEADKSKMGLPLWKSAPKSITGATMARSTLGETYNFIIEDLEAAKTLLTGVVFTQKARVNEWAVKSYLGKAYIFTLQYDKARDVLKDVIDNSGKTLVTYDILRNMFNLRNQFNSESVFEINFTRDQLNTTGANIAMLNTGSNFMRGISCSYVDANGVEQTNGFGNLLIHDMNIPRYGFDDPATSIADYKSPAFKAKSLLVRADKSVDPRLYVTAFQPYIDSIKPLGVWRIVGKNRVESYNASAVKAWNHHKYNIIDRDFNDNNAYTGMNIYAIRLAEVYLLYAEALIKAGTPNTTLALEYINKVHRRAYDQNPNVPSVYDYATLTDRTKTVDATDPLANDPLKYERWAEFCTEGVWWLDVRRFNLGAQEAAYYKKVMGGALVWRATKYAMPIPNDEMNSNSLMVQNPGY